MKPSWGRIPVEGVFPLCPTFDTVGPMAHTVEDVALMWSVLAEAPVPEPRLAGLTVGLLTKPPSVGGAALPENRAAEQYVERLEELGARVVEAESRAARRHVAALLPRSGRVAPRDVSRARRRVRRQRAREARARADDRRPTRSSARARRSAFGGRTAAGRPLRRAGARVELPPVDCDELEVRIPLTAFLRPFNVLGWAALAIGDLQLDRTARRGRPRRRPSLVARSLGACRNLTFLRCLAPRSGAWHRFCHGVMSFVERAGGGVVSTAMPNSENRPSSEIEVPPGVW